MINVEELKKTRLNLGLTQKDVAKGMFVTRCYISSVENKSRIPSPLFLYGYFGFLCDYEKNLKKIKKVVDK